MFILLLLIFNYHLLTHAFAGAHLRAIFLSLYIVGRRHCFFGQESKFFWGTVLTLTIYFISFGILRLKFNIFIVPFIACRGSHLDFDLNYIIKKISLHDKDIL